MAASVIIEEEIEIPMNLRSLADFRRWALSGQFPDQGRIDFVAGKIEVDMSPEDVFCHGKLKVLFVAKLFPLLERADGGHLFTDRTRVSAPSANLSVEPDIVFISHDSLKTDRVRLIPRAGDPRRYVELEGAPDLIIEIVSDSSQTKDTQRLPRAYAQAGVREFWLADARKEPLLFQIYHLKDQAYQAAEADTNGFFSSNVFGCRFRLDGDRDAKGYWKFDLAIKE
jgi:Uma2 family endonuclease